jgi:hypothetical protein
MSPFAIPGIQFYFLEVKLKPHKIINLTRYSGVDFLTDDQVLRLVNDLCSENVSASNKMLI